MANYIREPYSADLDFGTGEWSVSAWVNVPVTLPPEVFPVGASIIPGDASTFNSATGWIQQAGWSINTVAGTASYDGVGAGTYLYWSNLDNAKKYKVVFTLISGSVKLYGGAQYSSPDVYTAFSFPTSGWILFERVGGSNCTIDNVQIYPVEPAAIVSRAHISGATIHTSLTPSGQLTATAYDGASPARTVTTTAAYNTGTWTKAEACYTTDGTLSIRVNGQQVEATYGAPLLTLNNSNAVLTIGNSYNLDAPFLGSLALLKLSATVPTAEQSQWMYEQEKQMFREGAQVTLPDSNAINDLTYDEVTDKWIAVSGTNMSEWSGLVRTNVTAVPSGSYSKLSSAGGVTLQARGSNVDITIPSYGLRKELVKRAESAAKLARSITPFDYVGGFTATTSSTTNPTALTSVAGLTYPTSYIGAQITGTGIQAGTVITAVNGTTIYISKPATATGTAVQISFTDFILPVGREAKVVVSSGFVKQEGSTKDYTRLFDGFKETIRFGVAPGYQTWVQIQATNTTL